MESKNKYDLEDRTLVFARVVRDFVLKVNKNLPNFEYSKQLIRSSSSIGANYIEANEALGRKDRLLRLRTSRKEAKESRFWLRLIIIDPKDFRLIKGRNWLQMEALELVKILSSIILKMT